MSYNVTPADIRNAAFGVDVPTGATVDAQLAWLIAKAERRLDRAVRSLASRVAAGAETDLNDLAKDVVEDMVLRVVKNPHSLRTIGTDDFQSTIDAAISSGALYVTPEEATLLAPVSSAAASVGSIRLGVPAWRVPGDC